MKTDGAIEMLTMGLPDQYSTTLASPLLWAVMSARVAVEYK
jgi:hypothetical protein